MNIARVFIPTISSLISWLSKKSDDSLNTEQEENVSIKCLDPREETLSQSSCPPALTPPERPYLAFI